MSPVATVLVEDRRELQLRIDWKTLFRKETRDPNGSPNLHAAMTSELMFQVPREFMRLSSILVVHEERLMKSALGLSWKLVTAPAKSGLQSAAAVL
jgi:hypothetical protein